NETGDLFAGGSLGLNTTAPTYGLQQLGGGFCQQMLGTPTNFTVTNGGTSGSTTYNYWLYAVDRAGRRTLAATATIANANATLSSVNFNSLSWTAVTGAAYYLIAKGSATNIIGQVATTSFSDIGLATVFSITAPTHDETGDAIIDSWVGIGTT